MSHRLKEWNYQINQCLKLHNFQQTTLASFCINNSLHQSYLFSVLIICSNSLNSTIDFNILNCPRIFQQFMFFKRFFSRSMYILQDTKLLRALSNSYGRRTLVFKKFWNNVILKYFTYERKVLFWKVFSQKIPLHKNLEKLWFLFW